MLKTEISFSLWSFGVPVKMVKEEKSKVSVQLFGVGVGKGRFYVALTGLKI